jgi:signal transduction histidine kinase
MRTLRRTLIYQTAGVILCLLVVSVAAVWGIQGLTQDLTLTSRSHERLRDVYEIGSHVATARTLVTLAKPELEEALQELDAAAAKLEIESEESHAAGGGATPDLLAILNHVQVARTAIRIAIRNHQPKIDAIPLQKALGSTAQSASIIRASIQRAQDNADRKRKVTTIAVAAVAGLLIAGAIGIGAWQYRSIMRPVTQLNEGVRHIASGEFTRTLPQDGHLEFASLARDFNHMAAQLDQAYHHLEQQVEEKSRELVRSQHLASVGFLAAGVAHEINNPLGVITGFAEFTLEQIRQSPSKNGSTEQIDKALQAICDEAFRCKQITEKLLSMARSTESPRSPVDLAAVAEEVIAMMKALKPYQERKIHFANEVSGDGDATITASEAEMKQVVLNLLTNALEAANHDAGEVWVAVRRVGKQVELSVKDNGRGMSAHTLESVFEPFFTLPREGRRGTGLGLSITHAIVDGHQGSIRATSSGLGQGSEFTATFPAAS